MSISISPKLSMPTLPKYGDVVKVGGQDFIIEGVSISQDAFFGQKIELTISRGKSAKQDLEDYWKQTKKLLTDYELINEYGETVAVVKNPTHPDTTDVGTNKPPFDAPDLKPEPKIAFGPAPRKIDPNFIPKPNAGVKEASDA